MECSFYILCVEPATTRTRAVNMSKVSPDHEFRDLLKATLAASDAPVLTVEQRRRIERHFFGRPNSEPIGTLPIPLQHLCALALRREEAFHAEVHRRCVEDFGTEDYDHIGFEMHIYGEVENNPRFDRAPRLWGMLERRVRRQWHDELTTEDGHEVIFYIDGEFRVFRTDARKETRDEQRARIRKIRAELDAILALEKEDPEAFRAMLAIF